MYKSLVGNYVRNMSIDKLREYVNKNYRNVSDSEIKVIYKYIKNYWQEIYDEDKTILNNLKNEVSPDTYREIIKLLDTAYNFKNR